MSSVNNDNKVNDQAETIRQIQEYQQEQQSLAEQQEQVQAEAQQTQVQAEGVSTGIESSELDSDLDVSGVADGAQLDIQAQVESQQVAETNEITDATGTDKAAGAVDTANNQQDRAEAWQSYAAEGSQIDQLPPTPEEQAAADEQRKKDQSLNVGDLMKQMSIQSGKIGA